MKDSGEEVPEYEILFTEPESGLGEKPKSRKWGLEEGSRPAETVRWGIAAEEGGEIIREDYF